MTRGSFFFLVGIFAFCSLKPLFAKPFANQTLKVLSFRDNHSDAVLRSLKQFEDLTGARVKLDLIASNTVATKTLTDQMAGGSYDLYTVDEPFFPSLSPFLLPLASWPSSSLVAKSELASEKYLQAAVKGTMYQGVSYGLPINSNVYMYIYRKDLFEDPNEQAAFKKKYGYALAPPKTMQAFADVAAFFTRPPSMYGFAPFTKKSEGTTVEAIWVLSSFGVRLFDEDLKVILDKEKAAAAFSFYRDMMAFAPRGAKSWHHSERMASYRKGKVAQIMTWPGFLNGLEDPSKSRVVGKNRWALPPSAAGASPSPVAGTWGLAIPKSSQNKALAAAFAAYWGSYTFGKTLVPFGMNPARTDLLKDPLLSKQNPWFSGILAHFGQAIVRPRFPAYKRVSDRVSYHFTRALSGQVAPKEAAHRLYDDLVKMSAAIKQKRTH